MPAPTPADVAAYLGVADDDAFTAKAAAHLPVVTAFVYGYTRGRGFDPSGVPEDDVAAVVVTSTARLMANPELTRSETTEGYSITHPAFLGWTLPELAVLHRHRRRAA